MNMLIDMSRVELWSGTHACPVDEGLFKLLARRSVIDFTLDASKIHLTWIATVN